MNSVYLSREPSDSIKGILIILIVLCHNHVLAPNNGVHGLMGYFYLFHVACFFVLPFFYDSQVELSWKRVQTILVRTWVPYLWTCIMCWLVLSVFTRQFAFGWEHICAFMQGTQSPIRKCFGFVFPWFLPTFCSFSIMLMCAKTWKWLYWTFFVLSLGTWAMTWPQFYQFKNTVPLGFGLALSYFGSGVIAFFANKWSRWSKYVGTALFVVLSLGYWFNWHLGYAYSLFPVSFFLLLLCIVPYMNWRWLRVLGQNSLGIYLMNMFVGNICYILLPRTIPFGIIGFLCALLVPLAVTVYVNRVERLRKIVFPRHWEEFKAVGKTC